MSELISKEHQILPAIRELNTIAQQADDALGDSDIGFNLVVKRLSYLLWCLEKSEEELLDSATLDGMFAHIQTLKGNVAWLVTNSTKASQVSNTRSQMVAIENGISNALKLLDYPRVRQIFKSEAVSAINQVIEISGSSRARIEKSSQKQIEELTKKIENLEASLTSASNRLDLQTQRMNELIDEKNAFDAKIRSDAAGKAAIFDDLIDKRKNELKVWQEATENEGNEFLGKIQSFYRLSADTTLAGRFIQASREETTAYLGLTALSLVFFAGSIWGLLFGISFLERALDLIFGNPWTAIAARISMVLVFIVPAGVFSQQAAKHRRASVWYKTMGVRVATLKPYLEEFTDENLDYNDELKEILRSFFISELKVDSDKKSETLQLGVLEELLSRIKNLLP